jgi:AraC family transcriptional regulator
MSVQESPELSEVNRFPEILERPPVLTSYDAGWSGINLELQEQPPGETPEFCLNHDVVVVNPVSRFQVEQVSEGTRQKALFFPGVVAICPKHQSKRFLWDRQIQVLSLNLKPDLLVTNAIELLEKDDVELVPHLCLEDGLILHIGMALQAQLQSQGRRSRLYAETITNALIVHLLQHYSTHKNQVKHSVSSLPRHKLKLVIDYIDDNLGRELSLPELAAIVQLSQYHFCHAFKQAIELSPHQYLIQQRVERAKQLLKQKEMTIGEVAIACGFAHQSHLNRHFKRLTGITPKIWQNS